jgi:hypothetical protein
VKELAIEIRWLHHDIGLAHHGGSLKKTLLSLWDEEREGLGVGGAGH